MVLRNSSVSESRLKLPRIISTLLAQHPAPLQEAGRDVLG